MGTKVTREQAFGHDLGGAFIKEAGKGEGGRNWEGSSMYTLLEVCKTKLV